MSFLLYLFIFGWQVGCEDGTVKLFEVCEGKIQFERNLAKQKGRVISLSWHPSGSRIAAGMMGMIRIFDIKTGTLIMYKNKKQDQKTLEVSGFTNSDRK